MLAHTTHLTLWHGNVGQVDGGVPDVIRQCRVNYHEYLTSVILDTTDRSRAEPGHAFGVSRLAARASGEQAVYAIVNKFRRDVRETIDRETASLKVPQRDGSNLKNTVLDVVRVEQERSNCSPFETMPGDTSCAALTVSSKCGAWHGIRLTTAARRPSLSAKMILPGPHRRSAPGRQSLGRSTNMSPCRKSPSLCACPRRPTRN